MASDNTIKWNTDFDSALQQAREKEKNLLIDFTAAPM